MSATQIPTSTQAWLVDGKGIDGLELKTVPVPAIEAHEVLVKFHAVSLNYRDLLVAQGSYPMDCALPVVPCSDGGAEVIAVGAQVTSLAVGDVVATLFNQGHQFGALTPRTMQTGLGASLDGALRQFGVFAATGLVRAPAGWGYAQAATLPCAALTAWNALHGGRGARVQPGDAVLVQGSGGVSVFALQLAKAAGAFVAATTSSDAKAARLRALGADAVLNYRSAPEWGLRARALSPRGEGYDFVIEVGGEATLAESVAAVKMEGTIAQIGFVGGAGKATSPLEPLLRTFTHRGICVGSRALFLDMVRGLEVNKIEPVIDEKVFEFTEAKEAYEYLKAAKHFGKLVS